MLPPSRPETALWLLPPLWWLSLQEHWLQLHVLPALQLFFSLLRLPCFRSPLRPQHALLLASAPFSQPHLFWLPYRDGRSESSMLPQPQPETAFWLLPPLWR